MILKKIIALFFLLAIGGSVYFLKGNYQQKDYSEAAIDVVWTHSPSPLVINSPIDFTFNFFDSKKSPLEFANLEIEATMNHAGMTPVYLTPEKLSPGKYRARGNLTMSGDWIFIFSIKLNDGSSVKKQIDFKVPY